MNRKSSIFLLLLLFFQGLSEVKSAAPSLEKAYEALWEYDYFKARKLFHQINSKKAEGAACYGLALITARNDNPFFQPDTAALYINRAFHLFLKNPLIQQYRGFLIDSVSIRRLADSIAEKALHVVLRENTVNACDHFLVTHFLCHKNYTKNVLYLRDQLEFNQVLAAYRSDSTRAFILTHPQSLLVKEALLLLDRQTFEETTKQGTKEEFLAFLRRHPKNVLVNTALESLFDLYKKTKDQQGLSNFVFEFPKAPQELEAWKLLFSLSVKAYTFEDLKTFVDEYPKFPLKNSILKDLELNNLVLYPLQMGDYSGFINQKGTPVIPAEYDEVSEFSEGLAVVSRNDTTFYINKENQNPFGTYFAGAGPFHSGIAPVRQDSSWYFINRLGQIISSPFDEIQEFSGGAYVYRRGHLYGALDQFGQPLIEPQFSKLGDFKNGYAYYIEQGRYGFVSREGIVYKGAFEWISDFNEEQIAVIRQEGRYGLIRGNARPLLDCNYDLIVRAPGRYFIVVKDNQYGFFSFDGCFNVLVQYEYTKEKSLAYYTNGRHFRLIRKTENTLADENGKILFTAGTYDDFGFPAEGLLRVKQRNKWAYLDKRLQVVIPLRFQAAEDFEGGCALVQLKDKFLLIAPNGEELYSSLQDLKRLNAHYFLEEAVNGQRLIGAEGKVIVEGLEEATVRPDGAILLRFNNGEIKLIND